MTALGEPDVKRDRLLLAVAFILCGRRHSTDNRPRPRPSTLPFA